MHKHIHMSQQAKTHRRSEEPFTAHETLIIYIWGSRAWWYISVCVDFWFHWSLPLAIVAFTVLRCNTTVFTPN